MEQTTPAQDNIFEIPVQNVPELEARIAKLNKRADKLSVAPVVLTKLEIIERERDDNGVTVYDQIQRVQVEGESPKLDGWQFVATLEHDENGTLIRKIPTFDREVDLTPYREATPDHCDQCGYKRRRNDTYIVAHETGEMKQVGSNCLVDFLGGSNPQQIARYMEYVADLMDEIRGGGFSGMSEPNRYDTHQYLSHVAAMIRTNGWTSRGQAWERGGNATSDQASDNLFKLMRRFSASDGVVQPTDEDTKLATETIEWARNLSETDLANDYMYNLYTSLKGDSIPSRQFGIAASGINAYQRQREREIKRAAENAGRRNEHFGEVDGKVEFTGTVTRVTWIEDTFNGGTKPLYIFRTDEGFDAKWFSSRDLGLDQGDKVFVKGTVKKHESSAQYGNSTVVTRCKVEVL